MPEAPILYVEDEITDVILIRYAARKAHLQNPLQVVENGALAIQYLGGEGPFADRAHYPFPALVLLDLNLPIVSGFEVLSWIRGQPQLASLPVIVFSGSDIEADRRKAQELGANGYEVKPGINKLPALLSKLQAEWLGHACPSPSAEAPG